MARILKGDVVWADLDPVRGHEQGGRRPVVIISEDVFNARSGTVIALAITSQPQRAGYPLRAYPKKGTGLLEFEESCPLFRIGSYAGVDERQASQTLMGEDWPDPYLVRGADLSKARPHFSGGARSAHRRAQ